MKKKKSTAGHIIAFTYLHGQFLSLHRLIVTFSVRMYVWKFQYYYEQFSNIGGEALLCYMWKVGEKKQSSIYLSLAILWVIGNESEAVMHGRGSIIYKSTLLSTGVKVQRWHLLPGLPVVQKERNPALHYRQKNIIPCVEGPYEGLEVNGDLNVFQILV